MFIFKITIYNIRFTYSLLLLKNIRRHAAMVSFGSEVGIISRCTAYSTYKVNPNMESYITDLQSREIIIFATFRCHYNHLPIASYTDVKVCTLCSKNDIGDEYHYVSKCDYFDNERKLDI